MQHVLHGKHYTASPVMNAGEKSKEYIPAGKLLQ
jgi:hypothetical protein